jgi:hypothetical protein
MTLESFLLFRCYQVSPGGISNATTAATTICTLVLRPALTLVVLIGILPGISGKNRSNTILRDRHVASYGAVNATSDGRAGASRPDALHRVQVLFEFRWTLGPLPRGVTHCVRFLAVVVRTLDSFVAAAAHVAPPAARAAVAAAEAVAAFANSQQRRLLRPMRLLGS